MYIIQASGIAEEERLFSVGSAGLAQAGLAGENTAANHTATIPAILVFNPAYSGVDAVLMGLSLYQIGTVASARPEVLLGLDLRNRRSSGGGELTPVNRLAGGRASKLTVYHSPAGGTAITATAASTAAMYFDQREFLQTVSGVADLDAQVFDFGGSVIIQPGWSFLVHIRSNGANRFNAHWNLDFEERSR